MVTMTSIREATMTMITISLAMATAMRVTGNKEGDGGKSDDDDTPISLAMGTATRVAGDEESDSGKSDGDDKKGCGRATATATKRAMAAATRAAGDKDDDGMGGESDGDAYKEGNGRGCTGEFSRAKAKKGLFPRTQEK